MSRSRKNIKRKKAASKHGTSSVPSEASEFLRLIARILRRRPSNQELAEDKSPEAIPGVEPKEHQDIEDTPEEDQG